MNKYLFPRETAEGKLQIQGNKIIPTGNKIFGNRAVNIDNIQVAYLIVYKHHGPHLFLTDPSHHSLPAHFSGFKEVYTLLSEKYGFDDEIFFNNVYNKTEANINTKNLLWRKMYPQNYKLVEGHKDYAGGFEVLSPEKEFISWDAPRAEVLANANIYVGKTQFDQDIHKFKYPIRIGNLILGEFNSYKSKGRLDAPMHSYYSYCIDKTNSGESYNALKAQLQKDFALENQILDYERDDQKKFSFDAEGMLIELTYTFDSEWQHDGGQCYFSISNRRDYPELLVDEAYESAIEISASLEFSNGIRIGGNYKGDASVKRRPPKIESRQPIVWIDSKNSKIGFAGEKYSQVFDKNEIAQLSIHNTRPARGSGGASLLLTLIDNSKYGIAGGEYQIFDSYKEQLEKLTGLTVVMAPEGIDD